MLNRQIDLIMGLGLSSSDLQKLEAGYYRASVLGINQTGDAFPRFTPIFLNVEVKRPQSSIDPLVQLAVWVAAEFKKRAIERWDRSMPVMAVTIDGHIWNLYIVYEPDFESEELTKIVFTPYIEMQLCKH
jgi:hypothetical protein